MPILKRVPKIITVTQNDPVFDGSIFQNDNFTLLMYSGIKASIANEIGRRNARKEWEDMGGEGDIPNTLVGKNIICSLIEDWTGFYDEDGDVLECTQENKSAMYDFDAKFFDLVYTSYAGQMSIKVKEEDAVDEAMGKLRSTSSGTIRGAVELEEPKTATSAV